MKTESPTMSIIIIIPNASRLYWVAETAAIMAGKGVPSRKIPSRANTVPATP